MSRRSSGFTGANAIPLGTRNRAIGAKRQFTSSPPRESEQQYERREPQMQPSDSATIALKAAQAAAANLAKLAQKTAGSDTWSAATQSQPTPPASLNSSSGGDADRGRPRKKKSRWATETVKTVVPGMPTTMPTNLTPQQERAYIVQLQIEDITRKLKSGDLGIAPNPEDRSPSPEPIYNGEGKRMNTREYRTRKRLEEERHKLVQDMTELNTEYKPPADYKPLLQRVSERVAIPADINPNINFVGLLIGPRGNTLKKIEKESNCKIMIRGKGSVKEGKVVRKDNHPLPGEDEPLHALVSSNSIENVKKAVNEIQEIIKQGIEQPEEENDLRKLQLMELAKLNGTLREDLMPRERAWLRPENQNITNTTICNKCGGRGHLAQDCRSTGTVSNQDSAQGGAGAASGVDRAKMDSEYMSLMAEIGEHPAPATGNDNKMSGGGGNSNSGGGGGNSNNGGGNNNNRGPRGPMMNSGNNYNQGNNGNNGGSGPRGGYGGGGPRPPWMGGGGPRGPPGYGHPGGPRGGGYGPRGGGGGGGYGNGPPMMGRGGPPPPWMAPPGAPYGNPHNQWGPPGGMNGGGYPGMNPHEMGGDGGGQQMAPWQQQQQQQGDGQQQQAGGGHYGQQQGGMYGGGQAGGDQSGYGVQQPPPPPPTSAPQPPPPPSSSNDMSQWQQQWTDTSGQQQADNSAMGYGNAAMWSSYGNPPPMPSGPGPVPPPPPTSGQDGTNSGQMDYNAMMGGYAMPPAPPPPPPQ